MNKLTQLLKIKHPIIQGGMAGVSEAILVSAVSNAGGLGTIGSGLMTADWLDKEIKKTRELTEKPFAVNLFLRNPNIKNLVTVVIQNKVPVVITGGGNPIPLIPYLKEAGITIISVVPSPRLAKKVEDAGVDAVVAEGLESGGHIGKNTTFCLIPQTRKILERVPLIAAGGIYDGVTAKAAFLLGADGIQMGTRFLATKECQISPSYKQKVIEATADDIKVILRWTGHPLRVIKNKLSETWEKLGEKGAFPEEIRAEMIAGVANSEDVENIPLFSGLSAAGISEIKSCREIIEEIASQIQMYE